MSLLVGYEFSETFWMCEKICEFISPTRTGNAIRVGSKARGCTVVDVVPMRILRVALIIEDTVT